jgi:acyl-CoA reductase-like NAD-dependent aldehyde dehydrogenase
MESAEAFKTFRLMPAPQRGEIVRQLEKKLRENKEALGSGFLQKNLYKKDMEKFRK